MNHGRLIASPPRNIFTHLELLNAKRINMRNRTARGTRQGKAKHNASPNPNPADNP